MRLLKALFRVDGAPLDVQVVNSVAEGVHVDAVVLKLGGSYDCNECVFTIPVA